MGIDTSPHTRHRGRWPALALAAAMFASLLTLTAAAAPSATAQGLEPNDPVIIELSVSYTDTFIEEIGGEATAWARIAMAVNNTNISLANSGVSARVEVVELRQGQIPEADGNIAFARYGLVGTNEPVSDGAEFKCGQAFIRAGDDSCVLTFAHEVGHLLLASHCSGDDDPSFVGLAEQIGAFMTVMCKGGTDSYSADRSRRLLRFSEGNVAVMNERAAALAPDLSDESPRVTNACFSYDGPSSLISCNTQALIQEAEGTPTQVLERAGVIQPGRFDTMSDDGFGSSGDYFVSSTTAGEIHEMVVDVPETGNYTVTVRGLALAERDAAVWVEGGGKRIRWDLPTGPTWQYDDVLTANFSAGRNSITFEAIDSGAGIDVVRLRPTTARPAIDLSRRERARDLVAAFETLGQTTGSYVVGGGHNNSGNGAIYRSDNASFSYGSIAEALAAAGVDVDLTAPAEVAANELAAQRCKDRIAIFSESNGIAPTVNDATWWETNDCSLWAIEGGRTFFELSNPLPTQPTSAQSLDAIRTARVTDLVAAFQTLFDETNSVVASGGFQNRGTGAVYISDATNYSTGTIAEALSELQLGVDVNHPPELDRGEIIAIRCGRRIGIFSRSDGGIAPSEFASTWWADNNCSTAAIDNGRSYFQISSVPD